MTGPWLQAMNRTVVPGTRPCRPAEAFHLFQHPLDAAVQAQDEVRCDPSGVGHSTCSCPMIDPCHRRQTAPVWARRKRKGHVTPSCAEWIAKSNSGVEILQPTKIAKTSKAKPNMVGEGEASMGMHPT